MHRACCSILSGFGHIVKQMPRVLAEPFLYLCVLVRNECLLARTLLDKNPTFDDKALETEDVLLAVGGRGGGPSTIDRMEVAGAMITRRHAHDSQGEGGRNVWVWDGERGTADGRTRVG